MSKVRASYLVTGVDQNWITLRDQDGRVSVTNDAEAVVEEVLAQIGNRRIRYYDTQGDLGELIHDGRQFTGFGFLS